MDNFWLDQASCVKIFTNPRVFVESTRLAIIAGHPVQYVAPWLAQLARAENIEIHVFYLWDFGVVEAKDPGFGITLEWDIPLLEGYSYSFVPNISSDPGNHHFMGYINPGLARQVAAWKPDVVFLMNYAFLSYFLFLLDSRTWRWPILFRGDSHDVGRQDKLRVRISRLIRTIVFSRFSAFLDVGKNNRNYLLASGVPLRKLFHSPHAIDNQRFQAALPQALCQAKILRSSLLIREDQTLITFVGKFIAIKRPFDLLRAFSLLAPDIRRRAALLFVGEGSLKNDLRCAIRAGELEDVHFLDFQNQSSMPSVYSAADLLVLPSQQETWGLVVNEAMNLSCPALVSDHVGCAPDLIVSDQTGWVFQTGNVLALRDILEKAISDPVKLRQMGVNAANHVSRYSYEAASVGLHQALNDVKRKRLCNGF
ncbi:MAG: glycosyltransferase family 4 protein [Cyanobacteriota bacterium]|nr:glycosyltransferase family 4 protein [Cyanobacteriota bacterium]